jgi:hypothetical protein
MEKIKWIFVICILSISLLIPNNAFAFNVNNNQIVDSNKKWTVHFTDNVGFDDITKSKIRVTDSNCIHVNVTLELGKDGKSVIVNPPTGGYPTGNYALTIWKETHNINGKQMKQDREFLFTVVNKNLTISNINDIGKNLKFGDIYTLPTNVTATMSDGSKQQVSVT